jgi:DNA polymerase-4
MPPASGATPSPVGRAILHVDMDAFYASVEQHDRPELRGLPVIVGGTGGRGVVAAASYEVRRFGVRSAMPVRRALALCPQAVCVRPRMARYAEVSSQVFEIFHAFTPLVQGLSLDEAFLDVTDSRMLHGAPERIAQEIKQRIRERTGLGASVGVAPNKLVAKIASDLDKPDGLTLVTPDLVQAVLDPLPVRRLPGLGRKKGEQVAAAGIATLGALRQAPEQVLRPLFGRDWQAWRDRAAGLDDRPVLPDRDEKSVSNERTFDEDLHSPEAMQAALAALADKVASRLRAQGLWAACIGIKVRRADFTTLTRQRTLTPATCETGVIAAMAQALLDAWLQEERRRAGRGKDDGAAVRLLGVSATALQDAAQDDLFASMDGARGTKLDSALDAIRDRFGGAAVSRASSLSRSRR